MMQLLNLIPPSLSHTLALPFLDLISFFWEAEYSSDPFHWRNLEFKNRLGIAGGLDKNADYIELWQKLGFGFSEFGTITPLPQNPNPGKILARDIKTESLWNKMGFPNQGAHEVRDNLSFFQSQKKNPWVINIGKNRQTLNELAFQDYASCADLLKDFADLFVINVSSPNTSGLRALQQADELKKILFEVQKKTKGQPLLIKLSPDLSDEDLEKTLLAALDYGADGFILTNTTLKRFPDWNLPSAGGISGGLLKSLSESSLQKSIQILGSKRKGLLIISAGGVQTQADYQKRISLGADLVQIYSGFVFKGPAILKDLLKTNSPSE